MKGQEQFNKKKLQAKQLYKQGKIVEFTKTVQEQMINEYQKNNDHINLIQSLLLSARVQMELGNFHLVFPQLDQVKQIYDTNFNNEKQDQVKQKYTQQICKYYHIYTKSLQRSFFYQKSKDKIEEGFNFIKKILEKYNDIKNLYTCKLQENLALLFCEILDFQQANECISNSEKLYEAKKVADENKYLLFKIKKASIQKKGGYFREGIQTLNNLLKQTLENLKKESNQKQIQFLKKLKYKIYRDLSRLWSLKKDEKFTFYYQNLCEQSFFDYYGQNCVNIKTGKLYLIKAVWLTKFSVEQSNQELSKALCIFEQCCQQDNYFMANCYFEMGNNYNRWKEYKTATAFLYRGLEILQNLFTEDYPLMQKYYAYSIEVTSSSNQYKLAIELAQKQLEVSRKFNNKDTQSQHKDGNESMFILDPYLTLITIKCQTDDDYNINEIFEDIKYIQDIVDHNQLAGTQLLMQANTMKSVLLIRQDKVPQSEMVLVQTLEKQKEMFQNKFHPFIEQTYSQLGLIYKIEQKYEDAQEIYGTLIQLKEMFYGPESDLLVVPLKNMGQVQLYLKKNDLAIETLTRAVDLLNKSIKDLGDNLNKQQAEKQKTHLTNLSEILYQQYVYYEQIQNKIYALKTIEQHNEVAIKLYGDKSQQYILSLFMKCKTLQTQKQTDQAIEVLDKAMALEEGNSKNKKNSQMLARLYYTYATIQFEQKDLSKAKNYFVLSHDIFKNLTIQENEKSQILDDIKKQIQLCGDTDTNNQQKSITSSNQLMVGGTLGLIALGAATYALMNKSK